MTGGPQGMQWPTLHTLWVRPCFHQLFLVHLGVEPCPIYHQRTSVADYLKWTGNQLFLKTCFIPAFPNRPADCPNPPGMKFLAKRQPDFTPTPTLLQIHRDIVSTKIFSNNQITLATGHWKKVTYQVQTNQPVQTWKLPIRTTRCWSNGWGEGA